MKDKLKILSVPILILVFLWVIGEVHTNELDFYEVRRLGINIGPIILTCAILFFLKKEVINTWWYFSIIFWLFFFVLMFSDGGSGGGTLGGASIAVLFLSWIYFLLSLAIIGVKSWRLREK